jgi:hypothetical protein
MKGLDNNLATTLSFLRVALRYGSLAFTGFPWLFFANAFASGNEMPWLNPPLTAK